jgi:hypothetical protein
MTFFNTRNCAVHFKGWGEHFPRGVQGDQANWSDWIGPAGSTQMRRHIIVVSR